VSQARDAIDFAKEVTVMVNDAYQNYDSAVADAVNTVTGGLTSVVDGTVTGLTGPITGAGAGRA
jgi:hypothetical protein